MLVLDHWAALLGGVGLTLCLTVVALIAGLFIALCLSLCNESDSRLLKGLVSILLLFVRGTPVLVQLFLVYYGLGQFDAMRASVLWVLFQQPMFCAMFVLSINTGCYTSVILTGAIRAVPDTYRQAAGALGMGPWLTLRRIILPRAFQLALPAYSNEALIVLKTTSLASVITLMDIMGVTQDLISETYNTLYWYAVAAVLYLTLNFILLYGFQLLKRAYSPTPRHS